jgi:regulatory protein
MTDPYTTALRILNYRFNSEAELRRKLLAKKFEPAEVDAALERLRREKWLDDARFAGAFVRTRSRRKVGRQRIARELGAAGVAGETVAQAIAEHVNADDERAAAEELARKKMTILLRRNEKDAARNKVAAYLQRQGYDLTLVWEIVKKL